MSPPDPIDAIAGLLAFVIMTTLTLAVMSF